MNAPSTIQRPSSTIDLPWGMTPYKTGDFDKMHAAGSMLVSASNVAALFGLIPKRLGRLSYAMHLKGDRSLPDIGDEPHIRVGHALEPLVATLLGEELGVSVADFDAYARHEWLPMFATPDRVAWVDGEPWLVEIKVVTPKVYWEQWQDGPPIHVNLQHQTQFACCPKAKRGIVAVFNLGWCQLDYFKTEPHFTAIQRIELGVDAFMSTLQRGDLPEPDDTEVDADAFRDLMWKSDPDEEIKIAGDEAVLRHEQFIQAKLDEAAATRMIEANKRWFQRRMRTAQTAVLDHGGGFSWKTNKSKPKGADRPNRIFKAIEVKGEIDE